MDRRTKALFGALVALGVLATLEGAARLLPEAWTRETALELPPGQRGIPMFASGEIPGWDLPPKRGFMEGQTYTVNHWHMRGPEASDAKPPGTVRVILVGDSSIFGYLLPWEQSIGAQLEQIREMRGEAPVEVASCAAPGHSTEQSRRKLERHCLAFQPDVVIIGNLNSDATFDEESDKERFQLATSPLADPLRRLALYELLRNLVLRGRYPGLEAGGAPQTIAQRNDPGGPRGSERRVPPEDYARNLRRMIALSRAAGAVPLLLLLPHSADVDPAVPPGEDPYAALLREVALSEGVGLVDGPRSLREEGGDSSLFLDAVHPSAAGARRLATLVDRLWGHALLPADTYAVEPP